MYATDGDFGRVRLTSHVFPLAMQEAAACLSAAGWHRVNDRYGISRPTGGGEYLLLITVDGEGFLRLDEETHPLLPGGVAIVPPGCPHAYGVPPGGVWEFYWLHPAGGAAVRLLEYIQARLPAGRPPFLSPVDTAPYAREIEEILRLQAEEPGRFELGASVCTAALLYRLLRDAAGAGEESRGRISPPIIRLMEARYAEPLPVRELAARAYLSEAHFIRQFRRETGYTPHQYLNRVRVARAGWLLRFTDRTVAQVARDVGFRQSSRFIQLYKAITGRTPGQERG